ncbi:MAG: class I SAM-dependent methyltransferase, partial [bacterium]
MAGEAEMPGRLISMEQWQMICLRYYTVGKFIQEKEVLEVGCGSGLGLRYLSKRAKKVVGGDISKENIKCARQHYENKVKLLLMDAHKLPFKNEIF